MKQLFTLTVFSLLLSLHSFSQDRTITGRIADVQSKEPLIGANVVAKGNPNVGTSTDADGKFSLTVPDGTRAITVSYVGYSSRDISLTDESNYSISIEQYVKLGDEVVVTSSRVSESIKQAPVQIEKMTIREIKNTASGDFYQGLANFKGIDIVTSSAGWKTLNLRGFGDTRSLRTKQFVDGTDNESPGLNFPVANMVGANDLDLESVEVVSGASSALYGANAMQGVINMASKDPYIHKGVAVQIRGGYTTVPGPYMNGQFRYANTFGKHGNWAFKITGEYGQTEDWHADDTVANKYGVITTDQNLSAILREKQYEEVSEDFTQEDKDNIVKLNSWLDFNPGGNPGIVKITSPGYMEEDLADYNSKNAKMSAGLYYKFKNETQLSAVYKFGFGTAVYQATARYAIKEFSFHQPKLEYKGKNFFVRTYASIEGAGNSYNMGLTGSYISRAGVSEYVSRYIEKYFDVMDTLTGFEAEVDGEKWATVTPEAHRQAQLYAAQGWYQPGSREYDSLFQAITADDSAATGTKFVDKSYLWHIEGQYNYTFEKAPWLDLIGGASYRLYAPASSGTFLEDTGSTRLRVHEFGVYAQATARAFKDKLKIIGSLRLDKNSNFKPQLSPRVSLVVTPNKVHTFRAGWTMAFRTPTLQDQYLLLDIGRIKLLGNLNGYDNLFTLESVTDFYRYGYDSISQNYNLSLLKPITLDKLKPEQVMTAEIGYRGEYKKKVFLDISAYFSKYTNFIGQIRVARPTYGNIDSEDENQVNAGYDAILLSDSADNKYYERYQMWVNSKTPVYSWGVAAGLSYYAGRGVTIYANYTYSDLQDRKSDDPILPGFNTPRHKINIGVNGYKVWKGLGFSANFKWVNEYEWQSAFGDGTVPSFHVLDVQLNYEIEKIYTTLRLGGSNVYNNKHIEAYGSPKIGGLYYVGITFDMPNFGKEKK